MGGRGGPPTIRDGVGGRSGPWVRWPRQGDLIAGTAAVFAESAEVVLTVPGRHGSEMEPSDTQSGRPRRQAWKVWAGCLVSTRPGGCPGARKWGDSPPPAPAGNLGEPRAVPTVHEEMRLLAAPALAAQGPTVQTPSAADGFVISGPPCPGWSQDFLCVSYLWVVGSRIPLEKRPAGSSPVWAPGPLGNHSAPCRTPSGVAVLPCSCTPPQAAHLPSSPPWPPWGCLVPSPRPPPDLDVWVAPPPPLAALSRGHRLASLDWNPLRQRSSEL